MVEEELAELADDARRTFGPDDADGLGDVLTQVVLDAVEVVEEDFEQSIGVDLLLGELAF